MSGGGGKRKTLSWRQLGVAVALAGWIYTGRRRLFAWLFSRFFAQKHASLLRDKKKALFAPLRSAVSSDPALRAIGALRVLEIGPGPGMNAEFLPPACHLIAVEPNPYFERYVDGKKFSHVVLEKIVRGQAEDMSEVPDNSVDAVISTLVLCSVTDLSAAMAEVYRVLAPGGSFYYVEHVGYPEGSLGMWVQKVIQPVWTVLGDGCKLRAPISKAVHDAPFSKVEERHDFLRDHLYVVRPHVLGRAIK